MKGSSATAVNQYLTFTLGEEEFALEIGKVREVLDYIQITRVPRMPEYMCGVINLRGNVVPVVDLKLKFGLPATVRTVDTCIVIAEVEVAGEPTIMGALADSVHEVLDLAAADIEPPPRMGTRLNTDFIKGMGRQGDKFIIILDIDKVLSTDELTQVCAANMPASGPAAEAAASA